MKDTYDLIIYGGTAAAVIAAREGARHGLDVLMISPEQRIGGMTTGGLGDTDVGIEQAIGGLSREFYRRVGRHYGQDGPAWRFEPKVALAVLQEMLREAGCAVLLGERLDLGGGVQKTAGCIAGLHEVLCRQGLLEGAWCLDPNETLGPGQLEEIDRVYRAYPHLNDDAFVAQHLDHWLE